MQLDDLVSELDAYFSIELVRDDDWSRSFGLAYAEPYWQEFVEPGYTDRWNGLMLRGAGEVAAAATCVFPADEVVAQLDDGTFLFSEHPLDFADVPGFLPLRRETFEEMGRRGISFYHAHAPLDQHPEISPSRLLAEGLGLEALEEFFPIDTALPGGAAVIGQSSLTLVGLEARLRDFLGADIPVHVVTRPHQQAGRVCIAAGGGAMRELLEAALERGCETYVTGNAATNCELDFVQVSVRAFRELADERHIALLDATHYGTERPPQLRMVDWFRARGLEARFIENGPK